MSLTPNKNYNNQATGSNINTWGVINNSNFTIIDLNLGGRLSISVAGSANVTATANQAQNLFHTLTGAITGNITYYLPALGGFYFVTNNTTGSFTLKADITGGTGGVAVPQGQAYLVFSNPDVPSMVGIPAGSLALGTAAFLNVGTGPNNVVQLNGSSKLPAVDGSQLTNLPATFPTGGVIDYWGTTAPTGWVLASGLTIGNAASNGTARANADTSTLFTLLWNSTTNSELQMYNSTGSSVARGISAANDYLLNNAIAVPDYRGRIGAGKDNMGGSVAGRITNTNGVVGVTLGSVGGEETHILIISEMPGHNHTISISDSGHTHNFNFNGLMGRDGTLGQYVDQAANTGENSIEFTTESSSSGISATAGTTGGSGAHNNIQPTIISNKIIKL